MQQVEWMCTQCGRKELRNSGRPMPGNCPRNDRRPHDWVENRTIGK